MGQLRGGCDIVVGARARRSKAAGGEGGSLRCKAAGGRETPPPPSTRRLVPTKGNFRFTEKEATSGTKREIINATCEVYRSLPQPQCRPGRDQGHYTEVLKITSLHVIQAPTEKIELRSRWRLPSLLPDPARCGGRSRQQLSLVMARVEEARTDRVTGYEAHGPEPSSLAQPAIVPLLLLLLLSPLPVRHPHHPTSEEEEAKPHNPPPPPICGERATTTTTTTTD
uniref:Uncharacterized protein n=1 Tax=Oryza barthii TaxID=65489 RepID=A0A0D3EK56_9ORYZ